MGESKKHIGQVLHDTYRIERLIGRGGMGAVYEASHARLPRRFAVKLLFADVIDDSDAVARFRHEAMVTSQLGHPNIVEVVDFHHTEDGEPYIVMELLKGEDLSKRLRRVKRMTLDEATDVLEQTASALQAAHDEEIIHRDLKPQNIFLCQTRTRDDLVKVVDFGIAKILTSHNYLTRTKGIIGTPWYMSPERVKGETERVDHRSDIFSMGAMMYEMLTGRPPFTGESQAVLFQIVYKDPPRLRSFRPDIPEDAEQAIHCALSKEPGDRFDSMEAFARELVLEEYSGPIEVVDTGANAMVDDEETQIDSSIGSRLEAFLGRSAAGARAAPRGRAPACDVDDQVETLEDVTPKTGRAGGSDGGAGQERGAGEDGSEDHAAGRIRQQLQDSQRLQEGEPDEAEEQQEQEPQRKRTTLTSGIGELKPEQAGGRRVAVIAAVALLVGLAVGGIWWAVDRPREATGQLTRAAVSRRPSAGSTADPLPPGTAAGRDSGPLVVVVPAAPRSKTTTPGRTPAIRPAPVPPPKVEPVVKEGAPPERPRAPSRAKPETKQGQPGSQPRPRRAIRRPRGFGLIRVGTMCKGELIKAEVLLDGQHRGESPVVLQRVPAGAHLLTVNSPGYRPIRRTVTVRPGRMHPVLLELVPLE